MKSILLTSTALVAFAGAAAADGHAVAPVVFGGSAELTYNDQPGVGFASDAEISITAQRALDNGLTASATVNVNLNVEDGADLAATDYVLSLSSDTASLSFGDVDPVAAGAWSGVDGSAFGDFDEDTATDAVLAGSATFGATTASISYGVDYDGEASEMQLGVTSTFGAATVALAYQDDDHDGADSDGVAGEFQDGELLGVSVSTTLAGADVKLAMLTDMTENSFGVDVSYPLGAVTVGGYYTANSAADDVWAVRADYDNGNGITAGATYESDESWEISAGYASGPVTVDASYDSDEVFAVDATYDLGNGITLAAGGDTDDNSYASVNYTLGEGAKAFIQYASAAEVDPAEDLDEGVTVGVSFTF